MPLPNPSRAKLYTPPARGMAGAQLSKAHTGEKRNQTVESEGKNQATGTDLLYAITDADENTGTDHHTQSHHRDMEEVQVS